eukprot:328503-Amphidinium_carterae.1
MTLSLSEPRAFRMRSGCDTTTPCAPGNSRGMMTLSLLLAEGATVLHGRSQPDVHDEFLDGR